MRNYSLVFILCPIVFGCNSWQEKKLCGKWQASEVIEDGMPLQTDISVVNLEFLPNAHYNYTGTLKYKEAGTFTIQGDLLYTLDTINEASSEKAVKIMELTNDSLFIKMNAEGKERIVKLFKVK